MMILCADDEQMALDILCEAVQEAAPDANTECFTEAEELLEFARLHECDVAFLDIEMRDMNGLALAKKLKECNPKVNIIFVTGYDQYTGDAINMRASGYVMKPATKKKILDELENLRNPLPVTDSGKLRVQCFGNFEIYINNVPLTFSRSRTKELLAYLVFKRGGACTWQDIAAILYEDEPFSIQQRNRIRQLTLSLTQALRDAGAESVLIKHRNSIAIDTGALECDYYRFLNMELCAINAYTGEFMAQYEWAVFVTGFLDRQ